MDRNQKVWGLANTGIKFHAFVQNWADKDGAVSQSFKRAMCRKTIARSADMIGAGIDDVKSQASLCDQCVKLFVAMVARAEASMEPVNPYDQVCEGVVTAEGAARVADDKPLPPGMNRELLRQAKAVKEAHERLFPARVAEVNELNERTIDAAMPTRPDMNAVTEALDSPAVLDAFHAEALEEDARRTAAAHGVVPGARFKPRHGTHNNSDRIVTVTRVSVGATPDIGVAYDIWEPSYQGKPENWGSAVGLKLFLRLYEPETTAERDAVAEAIRTLRQAPYASVVQAMGVLERAGFFAETTAAPPSPVRWYYAAVIKAPGADSHRICGFVNALHPEGARQAVREDWADKLRSGEYLDYIQVEPS